MKFFLAFMIVGSIILIVSGLVLKNYSSSIGWLCVLVYSVKDLAERSEDL